MCRTLSSFLCHPKKVFIVLILLVDIVIYKSTHAQELSCEIGSIRLYECDNINGNSTSLQAYVSEDCDYLFKVQWIPSIQVNYFINRTELMDDDSEMTNSPYAILSYDYIRSGAYNVAVTVQGYSKITDPTNATALNTDWEIRQTRDDFLQITITDDGSCQDTTEDSGAVPMMPAIVVWLATNALAWLLLSVS